MSVISREHTDLGAYALGLLEDQDKRAFEAHLATCDACRAELATLSPIAGLLRGMEPVIAAGDAGPPVDLLHKRATASRRLRRRLTLATAAACAALLGAGIGVGLAAAPDRTVVVQPGLSGQRHSAANPANGVSGTVGLVAKGWGTQVWLDLAGVRGPQQCELVAVSATGERRVVTGWLVTAPGDGVPGHPAHLLVDGGTAISLPDLARFEVIALPATTQPATTQPGTTLLTIPVLAPERPASVAANLLPSAGAPAGRAVRQRSVPQKTVPHIRMTAASACAGLAVLAIAGCSASQPASVPAAPPASSSPAPAGAPGSIAGPASAGAGTGGTASGAAAGTAGPAGPSGTATAGGTTPVRGPAGATGTAKPIVVDGNITIPAAGNLQPGPMAITPLYCGKLSAAQQQQFGTSAVGGLIYRYTNHSAGLSGAAKLYVGFTDAGTVVAENYAGTVTSVGPGKSGEAEVDAVGISGQGVTFSGCSVLSYALDSNIGVDPVSYAG
jgi:hypothetical protein